MPGAGLTSDRLKVFVPPTESAAIQPVNVRDPQFGATADGTTDDLTAITAAIASLPAGGGAIYFPRGTYLISDRIAVDTSNVVLYGDGPGSKIKLQAGTGLHNAIRFNTSGVTNPATVPRLTNVGVRDLKVDCQGGDITWAAGGVPGAVVFYACDGVDARNLIVQNGRDYCVNSSGCTDVSYDRVTADGCYWQSACNPIQVTGSATVSASNMSVTNCRVYNQISLTLTVATRVGTTATFTTSAAHKLIAGQGVKVTGCTPADYNGFWAVATTPTSTTFTATLLSTPSGSASVLGTARVMADRGFYIGGNFSTYVTARGNISDHCYAGVTAEADGPSVSSELQINDNIATNFKTYGVGFTSSTTDGPWAVRCQVNDNVVRGLDGTTAFGMAGTGSSTGLQLQGQTISASNNSISNVREGTYIGNAFTSGTDELNFSVKGGFIQMATDATGAGIKVEHVDGTTSLLRRLKIEGVLIDGQLGTASNCGVLLKGGITGFNVSGNTIRGMGRSGIKLEASTTAVATKGKINDNICVDNANAGSTAINKVGIAVDAAADDIVLADNKCYDTRGGSALQTHGLYVESTATNVRSTNDDFTGNLTAEVNDQSVTIGFWRTDFRDPTGIGMAYTADPKNLNAAVASGGAGRTLYARVTNGGCLATKVIVPIGTIDSGTPGTTDQIGVAVYANKSGTGRSARPGVRKGVSASTLAVASSENTVSLTAATQVNVGDWLAVRVASATTQVMRASPPTVAMTTGLAGFEDPGAGAVPPSPAGSTSATTLAVPMIAIP